MHAYRETRIDTANDPEQVVWQLDWNLLRTFMVIVQEGGITAAARKLNLKQPTVSNALRRLEDSLGRRLVERGPRAFVVTRQGETLYQEAVDIFGSVSRLSVALRDIPEDVQGLVNLRLASHIICPVFDAVLRDFHAAHPQATLSVSVSSSQDAVEAVMEKRATLAVCLAHKHLDALDYTLMYREYFGFYCGPEHPLFGRDDLTIEDLRGLQSVSFCADQLDGVLRPIALLREQAELNSHVSGVSNHLEEVRRMIIAGLGIGPLPIHVVDRDLRDGLLWRLPPYENPPEVPIYIVQNPKTRLNRAEQRFSELLRARVAATPLAERAYGID